MLGRILIKLRISKAGDRVCRHRDVEKVFQIEVVIILEVITIDQQAAGLAEVKRETRTEKLLVLPLQGLSMRLVRIEVAEGEAVIGLEVFRANDRTRQVGLQAHTAAGGDRNLGLALPCGSCSAGDVVDAATDAAVGTVEHRGRTLQDLDALDVIERLALIGATSSCSRLALKAVAQRRTSPEAANVHVVVEGLILGDTADTEFEHVDHGKSAKVVNLLQIDERDTGREVGQFFRRPAADHRPLGTVALRIVTLHDKGRQLQDVLFLFLLLGRCARWRRHCLRHKRLGR